MDLKIMKKVQICVIVEGRVKELDRANKQINKQKALSLNMNLKTHTNT